MLSRVSWYLQLCEALAKSSPSGNYPDPDFLALYLWPGSGLRDPQEQCHVRRGPPKLPGLLADLPRIAPSDSSRRKLNSDRLRFHRRCDRERREAAARRIRRTGAAGLNEEELAALVPAIDLEQDEIAMQLLYPIVRLWDQGFDELLSTLPPRCLGLSLFGYRPEEVTLEEAVRRGGWALRRVPAAQRADAASQFAELAEVHLDPTAVRKILRALKLL
jgi:hypothetical protein